jgi:cytoskeletal protein RodZ
MVQAKYDERSGGWVARRIGVSMGELGRVRLPLRPLVVGIVAVLVASASVVWSAGTALAASPTPAPDPAPVSTTTTPTKATTTRTTTTPKPAVAPPERTRTKAHTTATTPVTATVSKPASKPVQKPAVKTKRRVTHKPKPSPPKQRPTTKPVVRPALALPAAAVLGEISSSGGKVGQTLLIVGALALLAISLVPTRFVVTHAGIEPARAAAIKTGFAVAGLSVGVGFLIALLLSKAP